MYKEKSINLFITPVGSTETYNKRTHQDKTEQRQSYKVKSKKHKNCAKTTQKLCRGLRSKKGQKKTKNGTGGIRTPVTGVAALNYAAD